MTAIPNEFDVDELIDGNRVLNQKAIYLQGAEAAFTVHYWGAEKRHYNNVLHRHSFFEICYVHQGEGCYLENDNAYKLAPGVLFLSRPYQYHQILSDSGLFLWFVAFELNEGLATSAFRSHFDKLKTTSDFYRTDMSRHPLITLWTSLLRHASMQMPFFEDGIKATACSLLTLFERVFQNEESKTKKPVNRISSSLVHQAKLFIRDNLSEPLKLKDVADHLHLSQRHLTRVFTSELGMSYSTYVRQQRVRQAANLLTETTLSIKEISVRTGFENVHYFTKVFTAEMGLPPGKFVKKFHQV